MPWYVTLYELLLQVSLAGCVLLALATVAVLLLREPARKVRVIELALLGLLALPMVTLIPGYPRLGLLPVNSVNEERVIANVTKNPLAKPGADREVTSSGQPPASPGGPATIDPVIQSAPPISAAPVAPSVIQRESAATAIPTLTRQLPTDDRLWIVCGYFTGAGILLLWSLVGFVAMRRLIRASQPADDATRTAFYAIAGDGGARVRLLVSPRAAQPCAFGWIRPTIVLPQTLIAGGDAAALRFALAHEWSHVHRGDVAIWTISTFARLLHFQQPLVWLLRQHLRRSQDYLADAAAVGAGSPEDYAEFLTSLSQRFKSPRIAPGLGIVSRRSDLHRRVVMLVEKQGSLERTPPRRWNAAILIAGLLAVAVVASLRAEPQEPHSLSTPPAKVKTARASKNESAAETDVSSSNPSNGNTDNVATEDPYIQKLVQEKEMLEMAMRQSVVNGGTYNSAADNQAAYERVAQLRREIGRVEEQIDKRKGKLRESITESQHTVRPLTAATRRTPFSGKIRPGDRLQIEIVGGLRPENNPPRTVEPDGNVVIGAAYGHLSRMQVGGMTLIEAGKHIEAKVRAVLKEPHVLVTYVGHDPDVIAEGEAAIAVPDLAPPFSDQPVVLAPLDTIEIILPLTKPRVHKSLHNGRIVEVFTGEMPQLSGTYLIEPDGRIALSQGLGRLAIAGMTEAQASEAMRKHLGEEIFTRTALPTTQILKRGHAVFPEGKLPDALYRIKPGDSLLIGGSPEQLFNSEVDSAGNVGDKQKAAVAGLTLEEAQMAVRKAWTGQATFNNTPAEVPWLVTIGGWREEAAPGVIDRIEGDADTRSLRLENEVQELKQMIRRLQLNR